MPAPTSPAASRPSVAGSGTPVISHSSLRSMAVAKSAMDDASA